MIGKDPFVPSTPFVPRLSKGRTVSKGEQFVQNRLAEGCIVTPFMLRQAQHERRK
jgi:hypothetical protein